MILTSTPNAEELRAQKKTVPEPKLKVAKRQLTNVFKGVATKKTNYCDDMEEYSSVASKEAGSVGHKITSFTVNTIDERRKNAELKISAFIAQHCSTRSVDDLGDMIKELDNKSEVLTSVKLHKTKCLGLIHNVITPCISEELIEDIGNSYYSMLRMETLLEGGCYVSWRFKLNLALKVKGLYEVASGVTLRQNESDDNKEWDKKDMEAQALIRLNVGSCIARKLSNLSSSYQMMQKLELLYGKKSDVTIEGLQRKFFSFEYNSGKSAFENCVEINQLAEELSAMGDVIKESWIMTRMLGMLPSQLHHFRTAWDNVSGADRCISVLLERLRLEEDRQQCSKSENAFYSKNKVSYNKSRMSNQNIVCYKCNKTGHLKKDCKNKPSHNACHHRGSQRNYGNKVNYMVCNEEHVQSRGDSDNLIGAINALHSKEADQWEHVFKCNGYEIKFKLDTGSDFSIVTPGSSSGDSDSYRSIDNLPLSEEELLSPDERDTVNLDHDYLRKTKSGRVIKTPSKYK
ncbi:hypothetical protein WDU94_015506 [Cyamophila willieti]